MREVPLTWWDVAASLCADFMRRPSIRDVTQMDSAALSNYFQRKWWIKVAHAGGVDYESGLSAVAAVTPSAQSLVPALPSVPGNHNSLSCTTQASLAHLPGGPFSARCGTLISTRQTGPCSRTLRNGGGASCRRSARRGAVSMRGLSK
jgi:hypothetical protein